MGTRNEHTYEKGHKRPGPGRPKGSKNAMTIAMKEIIVAAAHAAGDEIARRKAIAAKAGRSKAPPSPGGALEYLTTQALAEPKAFLSVLGRTIEKSIKVRGEGTPVLVFRDFTGLKLGQLAPSILKAIEKESRNE